MDGCNWMSKKHLSMFRQLDVNQDGMRLLFINYKLGLVSSYMSQIKTKSGAFLNKLASYHLIT